MRLRKLTIRKLPGIEPEFTLNEIGAGVNLVVGPNAIGKSSLTRALKYLLGNSGDDPPALSLEAELEDGETRWQVTRNGSHIAWRRDGAPHGDGPVLPGADQFGLYRLSVESLLDAGDAHDKNLAALLRRKLFGDCDLDALRDEIQAPTGPRFGRRESRALVEAGRERRQVVGDYAALERQEADLPALQQRIDAAEAAGSLRQHLEQALKLADAIAAHKACGEQLTHFPPEMNRLQGEELKQLDAREEQAAKLREELRDAAGRVGIRESGSRTHRAGARDASRRAVAGRRCEASNAGQAGDRPRQRPRCGDNGGNRCAGCARATRREQRAAAHRRRHLPAGRGSRFQVDRRANAAHGT